MTDDNYSFIFGLIDIHFISIYMKLSRQRLAKDELLFM